MRFWQSLRRLLDPSASLTDQTFSLGNRGDQPPIETEGPETLQDAQLRTEGVLTHIDNLLQATQAGNVKEAGDLSCSLDQNVERVKGTFRMPDNNDLIVREIQIATQPPTRAVVCFMEGLVDKTIINRDILGPLMLFAHLDHHVDGSGEHGATTFSIDTVTERLLPGHQTHKKHDMASIAEAILAGDTVLLFENEQTAITVETKGFPVRSVSEAKVEQVIQGPHDSFNEAFRVNVALVRRRLKDPRVVTHVMKVGQMSSNYVAMMYVDGVANPKLVAEVKRRIKAIKVDIMTGTGILEQYIEDSPSALMPGSLTTERPDRVAAFLSEGHVAVLVDNSPFALVCPITFWSLLQTAEDYYLRAPFPTFLRYLRLGALIVSMLVPALYIAVVNFHQEMIPTELLLFVAASRETIPLPSIVEWLLMDLSFELVREAGTRIPNIIGPTMGLVASLILGQAAVQAKIVSPLLIIIVALAGLSSFAIPSYMAGYGVRTVRFLLLGAAALLGFYGVAAGIFIMVIHLASMRSFGVPYLSPVAPMRQPISDILSRPALFQMEWRPAYLHPLDRRRQKHVVRSWDSFSRKQGENQEDSDQGGRS